MEVKFYCQVPCRCHIGQVIDSVDICDEYIKQERRRLPTLYYKKFLNLNRPRHHLSNIPTNSKSSIAQAQSISFSCIGCIFSFPDACRSPAYIVKIAQ